MTYNVEHVRNVGLKKDNHLIIRTGIYYLAYIIGGFLITGAKIFDSCCGFGISYVSACGAGAFGVTSLIGVCLGYIWNFGFDESAEYIASSVIVYTIAFVCQYISLYKRKFFMPVVAAIITLITLSFGVISTVRNDTPLYFQIGIETFIVLIMSCVYMSVKVHLYDGGDTHGYIVSLLICLSSFLLSLMEIKIAQRYSVGSILSIWTLLIMTYRSKPDIVCLSGMILALGTQLGTSSMVSSLYLYISYSVCMLIDYFKSRYSVALLITLLSIFIFSIHDPNIIWDFTTEVVIGSFIFILLPEKYFVLRDRVVGCCSEEKLCSSSYCRKSSIQWQLIQNIKECIYSCEICDNSDTTEEDVLTAMNRVCCLCPKKDVCWGNHGMRLEDMIGSLVMISNERGRVIEEDFPLWFKEYCSQYCRLIHEINFEFRKKIEINESRRLMHEYRVSMCELLNIVLKSPKEDNFSNSSYESYEEKRIRAYLNSLNFNCEVCVTETNSGKLHIQLTGQDSYLILKNTRYLDKLSEILNIRLYASKDSNMDKTVHLHEAELYSASVGAASKKKKGELVSGDQSTFFKTTEGVLYVLLSDGMGTGELARKQSIHIIHLLKRFLLLEVAPMEAIRLVDCILKLNKSKEWEYATIDLLSINLYTGDAEIYKLGAAPTYVLHNGQLICFSGTAMSPGMITAEQLYPDVRKFALSPGDVVVMMSDGVEIDDRRIQNQIILESTGGMKNCARSVLLESQKCFGSDDDMTVLAISIDYRD